MQILQGDSVLWFFKIKRLAERSKVDTLQERKTPKALKIQALWRV